MSGRYSFSLPEPQARDGWFRVGNVDVTTSVLVAALGVLSMVLYAIDPDIVAEGVFVPEFVRQGEVWRLVLWPLVNLPGIFPLLGLVVFWYFGRFVEDHMGRVPFTVLVVAMTVLPALVVTIVNTTNDPELAQISRWTTSSSSVSLLGLGMLCIFTASNPNAPFFFNIPGWVIAVALVAMNLLGIIGQRAWADLVLLVLVIAVGLFGARQRGMAEELTFIPRFSFLSGGPVSPYGEIGSARPKRSRPKRGGRGGRGAAHPGTTPGSGTVVSGPWGTIAGSGPTPLEQAELDSLLDIISERGVDSLTPYERQRLDELRRRLRGS